MLWFISALLIASIARGAPTATTRCGTHDHSSEQMSVLKGMTERFVSKTCNADPTLFFCDTPQAKKTAIYIKFAFHNIYNPNNNEGYMTQAQVDEQMYVLNNDYAGRGNASAGSSFQFVLTNLTRTGNADWFNSPTRYEREFKEALAISPIDTFNNYFTDMPIGLLGWCYFPSDYPEDSDQHGCVNLYSSIPNGGAAPYDGGQTVVHEIGHGLGLYHVFQGACAGVNCETSGDMVCDTPPQAESTSGCPRSQTSCTTAQDSYNNYMDYSYDECMHEFTPGQSTRMDQQVALHRPGLLGEDLVKQIAKANPTAWDEVRAYKAKQSLISK